MMLTITRICYLLAFVCFVLSAFGVPSRVNLLAGGLAIWMLGLLLAGFP